MIGRLLNPLTSKSFFLFGARGTGKSTLLDQRFSGENFLYFDLLDAQFLDDLRLDKERFRRVIQQPDNQNKVVVVDEVQKLPELLDYVQQLIVKEKRKFILTGSSARRLKQASTNLLAGRALVYDLFPFTSFELDLSGVFNLQSALEVGLLPEANLASSRELAVETLRSYVLTYIEKEIQVEQWVRKLEPFRIFLGIAAQMNGKIINRSSIAREVGVDDMTVSAYYEILEDTLLGLTLPAFHKSVRKAQRVSPKFFLIDPGIKRALDRTLTVNLAPETSAYGEAFEHFIFLELYKLSSYLRNDWRFSYFQTKDGLEIDLVINRPGKPLLLVEIKSKRRVNAGDVKSLELLGPALDKKAASYLLSQDPQTQVFGKTKAMFWRDGLLEIFEGKFEA